MKTAYETALEALTTWTTEKQRLDNQQAAIMEASRQQRAILDHQDALLDRRKELLQSAEDEAANSALTGVDIKSKDSAQARLEALDKELKQASQAAAAATTALSGLNRRIVAIDAEITEHQAKLAGLHANRLQIEGELEVAKYEQLHDQLTAAYGKIMACGTWTARLRGSQHPRLESIFKNRAPATEPPRFGKEAGRFDVQEHAELQKIMQELQQAGVDATLPSGLY